MKLTYPLKIDPWKRRVLLETIIFRGYVSFRECRWNRNVFFSCLESRPTLRELCGHLCLAGGLPVKVPVPAALAKGTQNIDFVKMATFQFGWFHIFSMEKMVGNYQTCVNKTGCLEFQVVVTVMDTWV